MELPTCSNCGARSSDASAGSCAFCGHALPPVASGFQRVDELSARFAALRAHPEYARLIKLEPKLGRLHLVLGSALVLQLGFVLLAAAVTVAFAVVFLPVAIVPLAVTGFGVWVLWRTLGHARATARASVRRVPVRVVGTRTEVSGGGERSASTDYFITLEQADGDRGEFRVDGRLVGRVSPDDLGVAFLKASHLVAFERVPGV